MTNRQVVDLEAPVPCEWFARCDRQTSIAVWHPILGYVPCCQRCAEHVGMNPSQWNARNRPAPA